MKKLLLLSLTIAGLSARIWKESIPETGGWFWKCDSDIATDKGFKERMRYYELLNEEMDVIIRQ